MNKEIKKASSLLEEKETKKKAVIAKTEAELKAVDDKLTALYSALDKADNAEQYKTLLAEIRDNEAVKKFCEKKVSEAKSTTLTKDEYEAIASNCKNSFNTLKAETEKALSEEFEKINKLLSATDADVIELNEVLRKAALLNNNRTPMMFSTRTIGSSSFLIRQYIDLYFRMLAAKEKGVSLD